MADAEKEPAGRAAITSVQSVERTLDIFELLAQTDGDMGVSDLSNATGLPVGTVHRLLTTLLARGYARQNPRTRRYALGYRALDLATRIRVRSGLREIARPYLYELMHLVGETVNLAVLDHTRVIYIEQAQPPRMVRLFTEIGNYAPLHSTGTGKVLMAFQSPERVENLLANLELPAYTASTITDREQLRAELLKVRAQGFATDEQEQEEGVRCIAAPVRDGSNEVVAALSISGLASRIGREHTERFLRYLQQSAMKLSRVLGCEPDSAR